jgi:hypothetical protein
MSHPNITALIQQYDAGNRSSLLALQVYTAISFRVAKEMNVETQAIADSDFTNDQALQNGIEWLRRKLPQPVNV